MSAPAPESGGLPRAAGPGLSHGEQAKTASGGASSDGREEKSDVEAYGSADAVTRGG